MKTQLLFFFLLVITGCGQLNKPEEKSGNQNNDSKADSEVNSSINNPPNKISENESEYDENYFKKELDGKYGFHSTKLGMPFKEFKNAVFVTQNATGTERVYTKSDENRTLGTVEFSLIQYKFYKNVLWCIYVQPKPGKLNEDNFANMVLEKYGNMTNVGFWQVGQMGISYKMDNLNGDAYLFYSLPMGKKFVDENKTKNKNAVNEL